MNIEDPQQLLAYLRATGRIGEAESLQIDTLAGGVSNRAVLVRRQGEVDWVIKQALPKLRVAVDWFSSPKRINREAAALSALGEIMPSHVPALVFQDEPNHILAMSAVPQPHQNWKALLLAGETSLDQARQFGRLLSRIHKAALHDPQLKRDFAERRFFEELRLEPYYSYAATQVPAAGAFLNRLIDETRGRRVALTHGDYSPKNILIADGKLILLDFEVMHFGDPAFDIGFSLTHLLSKAHFLPSRRAAFLDMARAHWNEYFTLLDPALARRVQPQASRHTLACLLARVAGRSPLEYLDRSHQRRQRDIALDLMRRDIANTADLIDEFQAALKARDDQNP